MVIGAGVIGLAIARRLARQGHEVLILEAEDAVGRHTSSHNSQVIHAGIYYPFDSQQRRLCVTGKEMLYDYCATRHVGHKRCGKLVVATREDQVPALEDLRQRGLRNGVGDLELLSAKACQALEPEVKSFGALSSPSTGIVDAPGLMLSLLGEAEAEGAVLAVKSPFKAARAIKDCLQIEVDDQTQTELSCTNLINAAGHGAWDVAKGVSGFQSSLVPPRFMAKGSYFSLSGHPNPFRQLIYPMPDAGSLGLHVVLDLAGQVKFGPDMEWVNTGMLDYSVDATKRARFETAIREYWPGLPDNALQPESSGFRPRIWGPDGSKSDFIIQNEAQHGVTGLVNMFGMESPGLTSCLAIAKYVHELIGA